jgi:hypothetical protein
MKTALLGMALIAGLSACADERPQALASSTMAEPEDDAPVTDDDGGEEGGAADRDAYVDALTAAMARSGGGDLSLPEDEAACVAEAVVDVIGLETLQENLTPDEIRRSSDATTDLWDLDLSQEQGEAILDGMIDCAPVIGELMAESLAQGIGEGFQEDAELDIDTACLAEDREAIRVLGAVFLTQGDSFTLDTDQADLFYDWLAGCTDMRQLTVTVMTGEGIPATGAACVNERMDDDLLRRFWVEVLVNLENLQSLDQSPIVGELAVIFEACADAIATTDA